MQNNGYQNFLYFLKCKDNTTKYKFQKFLEDYVVGDEDKRERLYLDKKTIDSNFKKDVFATEYVIGKLANWYKEFLQIHVDTDELTARDLSKTNSITWENWQIIGDFIGVYLDPTGSGDVKGMYLRLEEDDKKILRASAIHNLKNLDVLEIIHIGTKTMQDIYDLIKTNNRGSRLFSGKVDGNGEVVIIELLYGSSRHRSSLTLDISSYLKYVGEEGCKRPYSGGLGLQLVSNDIRVDSPYATRIGLIRCDKIKGIPLQDEQLKTYLSVAPHATQWGPLRLDVDRDRLWYEWFMRVHEEWEKTNDVNNSKVKFSLTTN